MKNCCASFIPGCVSITVFTREDQAAQHIGGLDADIAGYTADIDNFLQAPQTYSWDEESGYFSYVRHDNQGKAGGKA